MSAPETISTAYFVNPSRLFLYVHVVRKRLGENVTAALNTYAIIEEFVSYAVRVVQLKSR
jgi:hypothetical protein